MTTRIADEFEEIAARLNEIEREKRPVGEATLPGVASGAQKWGIWYPGGLSAPTWVQVGLHRTMLRRAPPTLFDTEEDATKSIGSTTPPCVARPYTA